MYVQYSTILYSSIFSALECTVTLQFLFVHLRTCTNIVILCCYCTYLTFTLTPILWYSERAWCHMLLHILLQLTKVMYSIKGCKICKSLTICGLNILSVVFTLQNVTILHFDLVYITMWSCVCQVWMSSWAVKSNQINSKIRSPDWPIKANKADAALWLATPGCQELIRLKALMCPLGEQKRENPVRVYAGNGSMSGCWNNHHVQQNQIGV